MHRQNIETMDVNEQRIVALESHRDLRLLSLHSPHRNTEHIQECNAAAKFTFLFKFF